MLGTVAVAGFARRGETELLELACIYWLPAYQLQYYHRWLIG